MFYFEDDKLNVKIEKIIIKNIQLPLFNTLEEFFNCIANNSPFVFNVSNNKRELAILITIEYVYIIELPKKNIGMLDFVGSNKNYVTLVKKSCHSIINEINLDFCKYKDRFIDYELKNNPSKSRDKLEANFDMIMKSFNSLQEKEDLHFNRGNEFQETIKGLIFAIKHDMPKCVYDAEDLVEIYKLFINGVFYILIVNYHEGNPISLFPTELIKTYLHLAHLIISDGENMNYKTRKTQDLLVELKDLIRFDKQEF
jgi:hypothetical protein